MSRWYRKSQLKKTYQPPQVPALDWGSLHGTTPAEKTDAYSNDLAQVMQQSPNPIADISGGMQDDPRDMHASPEMEQIWLRIQQLKRLIREKGQEALGLTGGDWQQIVQIALEKSGVDMQYSPEVGGIFGGNRSSEKAITKMLQNTPPEELPKVLGAHRQHEVRSIQAEVQYVLANWPQEYGVTIKEIVHLLRNVPLTEIGEDGPGSLIKRLGLKNAETLKKKAENIVRDAIGNSHDSTLGHLWSGQPEPLPHPDDSSAIYNKKVNKLNAMSYVGADFNAPGPITVEEVLDNMGLTFNAFPLRARHSLNLKPLPYEGADPRTLNPEQLTERQQIIDGNALDPKNISELRENLLQGDYYNDPAKSLGHFVRWDTKAGEMNNSYDEFIRYFFVNVCQRDKSLFAQALAAAGVDNVQEKLKGRKIPDEVYYQDFGLEFDSKPEQECVEALRNRFGLDVVPSAVPIPAIGGCNINKYGFNIDFVMPASVLITWREKRDEASQAVTFHPIIQDKMVFVGEYYGLKGSPARAVPDYDPKDFPHDGWYDVDGSVAKIEDENGQLVEARNGAKVSMGGAYNLRKRWKKMIEDFIAQTTGNKAIGIERPISDQQIIGQLEPQHIIYHYKGSNGNCGTPVCGTVYYQVVEHAKTCNLPDCPARNYSQDDFSNTVSIPRYSPAEVYVRAAIADFQIQEGVMPMLKVLGAPTKDENGQVKNGPLSREYIYDYYKTELKNREYVQNLRNEYLNALAQEKQGHVLPGTSETALRKYAIAKEQANQTSDTMLHIIRSEYEKYTQNGSYQEKLQGLNNILAGVKNGQIPQNQVKNLVDQYVKKWVWSQHKDVFGGETGRRWYRRGGFLPWLEK